MTNYRKGVRIEYIVRDYYRAAKCTVVRAAGSRGPADLIVFCPNKVLLIQCKKTTTGSGLTEFLPDIALLKQIPTSAVVEKWIYVLRTRKAIMDMYQLQDDEVCAPMQHEWKAMCKIAKQYQEDAR